HEVTEIDLAAATVTVRDLDARRETVEPYDTLLLATGAVPIRPRLPGAEADGIFGIQTLDDGTRLLSYMDEAKPRRAVVVGAGYIGVEMAEAMLERCGEVTVVERAPQPMTTLDPDMGAVVAKAVRQMGIELRTEEKVEAFEVQDGRVSGVVTESGHIPADLIVLGIGVRANAQLAAEAGVQVLSCGAIGVDRRMRTSAENVWAAGDCAAKYHRVSREFVAVPLGTHANKEGRIAGINIGGGYETFPGIVGTAVSKVCDLEVARTGLTEKECRATGFDYVTATVDSTTRAGYFPGASKIRIKLIVERRSGRLLGAQIVGREHAGKRIDALATALWNEMSVDEMHLMDLSYAPPFAPVWDPVLIAARKAWENVQRAT
ncbi:MAG TPA: FAD-dependent oxidoreductase, partial [Actinomycetota bacterium]|nr:FAD-dependent oxidoreductase [Actinomycetota bacterium]